MKIMNKILSKSNSYNYYKTNFEKLKKENKELIAEKESDEKNYENKIKKLNEKYGKETEKLNKKYNHDIRELNKKYSHEIGEMNKNLNSLKNDLMNINHSEEIINNELKYAFVFNDTIKNSEWLKERNFSLVNSAANYSFMYSLYRILNDAQPKNILEMGLGQTTKLTSQYAKYFNDAKLTVLESDETWIENFSKNLEISENIQILNLDVETFEYNNTLNLRFIDISKIVEDEKYDLIIIDGPRGFIVKDGKNELLDYSRSNIWQMIPSNLADDFIIIIDDYERKGERNTMDKTKELLKENDIDIFSYTSKGLKTQHAIFSEKYRFISWI